MRIDRPLQRSTSSPGLPAAEHAQDRLFSERHTQVLTAKKIPFNSDILHLQRPGTLRRAQESQFWQVIDLTEKSSVTMVPPHENLLSSRLQYIGLNRAATKLEFGFLKVDETAREELCRRFMALNTLMQENKQVQVAPGNGMQRWCWPHYFFHESHYQGDFYGGQNAADYADYHCAGLMHKGSTQLTHYHFHLGWKVAQPDGTEVPDNKDFLPDHQIVSSAAKKYVSILLQSLGLSATSGSEGNLRDETVPGQDSGTTSDQTAANKYAALLARLSVNLTGATYYDSLAQQGLHADRRHPISMNLERTPREIYAAALQRLTPLQAAQAVATSGKRQPGFREFSDLHLLLKKKVVSISEINGAASLAEALSVLKHALESAR